MGLFMVCGFRGGGAGRAAGSSMTKQAPPCGAGSVALSSPPKAAHDAPRDHQPRPSPRPAACWWQRARTAARQHLGRDAGPLSLTARSTRARHRRAGPPGAVALGRASPASASMALAIRLTSTCSICEGRPARPALRAGRSTVDAHTQAPQPFGQQALRIATAGASGVGTAGARLVGKGLQPARQLAQAAHQVRDALQVAARFVQALLVHQHHGVVRQRAQRRQRLVEFVRQAGRDLAQHGQLAACTSSCWVSRRLCSTALRLDLGRPVRRWRCSAGRALAPRALPACRARPAARPAWPACASRHAGSARPPWPAGRPRRSQTRHPAPGCGPGLAGASGSSACICQRWVGRARVVTRCSAIHQHMLAVAHRTSGLAQGTSGGSASVGLLGQHFGARLRSAAAARGTSRPAAS
jgi:hypothetical protein